MSPFYKTIRQFSIQSPQFSMIGRKTIKYPTEVSVFFQRIPRSSSSEVQVQGPLGSLCLPLPSFVDVQIAELEANAQKQMCKIVVNNPQDRKQRAMWGTARALIQNMIEGVLEGYTVPIRLEGVGYRVSFSFIHFYKFYLKKRLRLIMKNSHSDWVILILLF